MTNVSVQQQATAKRQKYKIHTSQTKEQAIHLAMNEGVKQAAQKVGAPAKSVKRWLKVGPYRKNAAQMADGGEEPFPGNNSMAVKMEEELEPEPFLS